MPDIRIKDLTTTASTTASDDFIAVDGTTNGTRKLSAFSPTFGGNATVTGTLTVNGGTTLNATLVVSSNVGTIGKSGTGTGGNWRFVSDDGTTRWLSGILGGAGETSFSIYDIANSRSLLTATAAGVVQINQTTASTTTSSGALVVSGGVGVAGAIYAGGAVNAQGILSTSNAAGVAVVGGRQWSIRANASGGSPPSAFVIRDDSLGSERVTIDASGNVTLLAGVLQLGNAYVAGAPTATGYIVIKDSTGTSYKIPAQAL
jgi:hypothetical protein